MEIEKLSDKELSYLIRSRNRTKQIKAAKLEIAPYKKEQINIRGKNEVLISSVIAQKTHIELNQQKTRSKAAQQKAIEAAKVRAEKIAMRGIVPEISAAKKAAIKDKKAAKKRAAMLRYCTNLLINQ